MKLKNDKKTDIKNRIIKKQIDEINSLKNDISSLEIDAKEKEKLIYSVTILHDNFVEVLDDLKKQREEYDKLIKELLEMKNTMNEIVFKKRWKLIKFLMK
jgi:hypothetical protein